MEPTTKKQERIILLTYFFVMLGVGLLLGKAIDDLFITESDPENVYLNLGCDKILRDDEFYVEHGHMDWVKRCQQKRLPF